MTGVTMSAAGEKACLGAGQVGVAVVGLGAMGRQHVRICTQLPAARLITVFDTDARLARSVADEHGVIAAASLEDALGAHGVEAVIIATPDHLHREVVERCIASRKHILLEKPLASALDEARAMAAFAEREEAQVMMGHTLRFDRRYFLAAEEARSGRLGALMHVSASRHNRPDTGARVGNRTTVTMFLGVHDLDAMMWIAGSRVARVGAAAGTAEAAAQLGVGAPAAVMALLEFESGAIGSVQVSWALPANFPSGLDASLEATFTSGWLRVHASAPGLSLLGSGGLAEPPVLGGEVHGYPTGPVATEVGAFLRWVAVGGDPPVSVTDGFNAVAVASAIDRAWRTGQPQTVDYST